MPRTSSGVTRTSLGMANNDNPLGRSSLKRILINIDLHSFKEQILIFFFYFTHGSP